MGGHRHRRAGRDGRGRALDERALGRRFAVAIAGGQPVALPVTRADVPRRDDRLAAALSSRPHAARVARVLALMRIGVPKETAEGERRVALVPEVVKRCGAKDVEVVVESGAGEAALIPDALFEEAGREDRRRRGAPTWS